jgi:hypothetical protein
MMMVIRFADDLRGRVAEHAFGAGVHDVIHPFTSLPMIASSEDSTMAANVERH